MRGHFIFDTSKLGSDPTILDGFIHIVPKRTVAMHVVDIRCWCDPRIFWPENGRNLVVSHRRKRQAKT